MGDGARSLFLIFFPTFFPAEISIFVDPKIVVSKKTGKNRRKNKTIFLHSFLLFSSLPIFSQSGRKNFLDKSLCMGEFFPLSPTCYATAIIVIYIHIKTVNLGHKERKTNKQTFLFFAHETCLRIFTPISSDM